MHKNLLWQSLLLLVAATALVYTSIALYRTYSYSRLKETTFPLAIDWKVQEQDTDEYLLEASYQFTYGGKQYTGVAILEDDYYLNPWAAEKAIKENKTKTWTIWFNPNDPSYSSLQKKMPIKQWASAAILWILCFYFLGLGYYVSKYKT
jgi:hypothetical protein